MKRLLNPAIHLANLWQLAQWSLLVVPVAILSGSASAFFLWALDKVTQARWSCPALLYFLPLGGVAVGFLYDDCPLPHGRRTRGTSAHRWPSSSLES
jgi:hypothetical protein